MAASSGAVFFSLLIYKDIFIGFYVIPLFKRGFA
jgi:hypothetical protein